MALQLSVAVRNAMLDAIEATIGATAVVKIWTGTQPADCATADSGTLLAQLALPADYFNAASSGTKTLLGAWLDTSANNSGTAGHFRVYDSSGTTCGMQGSVTATGGGGQLEVASTSITAGQSVTVTALTLTGPNA